MKPEMLRKNKEVSRQASFHGNAATVGLNTDTYPSKKDDWRLALVNESHPLDEGWKPELAEVVKDRYVDARILDAAAKMLEDAAGAGMSLYVCSAYRDYEKQREIFDSSMADRLSQGMDRWTHMKKQKNPWRFRERVSMPPGLRWTLHPHSMWN